MEDINNLATSRREESLEMLSLAVSTLPASQSAAVSPLLRQVTNKKIKSDQRN